jgi:hypothetical protein
VRERLLQVLLMGLMLLCAAWGWDGAGPGEGDGDEIEVAVGVGDGGRSITQVLQVLHRSRVRPQIGLAVADECWRVVAMGKRGGIRSEWGANLMGRICQSNC